MVSSDAPLVVGLGEVLWDLLPGGKQLGGAPANCAYHAQALGARAVMVSAVGDDEAGREILERLTRAGLDVSHVAVDPRHPTGTVSVDLDGAGHPTYTIHQETAWDYLPLQESARPLAEACDAVCYGTLAQRSPASRRSIRAFLASTRPDCLRVFDINLRQRYYDRETIEALLETAAVLKINDEELPVVSEMLGLPDDESEAIERLIDIYALRLVALSRGSKGSLLVSADERDEHAGFPAQVADTVGAGDAFTAMLTVGLLNSMPLAAINERANRLAAYVCSQPGPMPPIPDDLRLDGFK